jgi:cyclomaltodextrinase
MKFWIALGLTLLAGWVQAAPQTVCQPNPFGDTALFLRGSMNNWAAQEDFAFQYNCDAYYLNVKLDATHDFKVGDAAWRDATTVGKNSRSELEMGAKGNLRLSFAGEQTLKLAFAGGKPVLTQGPKTFVDPNARVVTDPVALGLHFDSRSLSHKRPFGAVVAGTPVEFSVSAMPGPSKVTLVLEKRKLEGNQEVLEYSEIARIPLLQMPYRRLGGSAFCAGQGGVHAVGGGHEAECSATQAPGPREIWSARYIFESVSVYGYWFEVEVNGSIYVLQNNRDPVFWTREKGSGGAGVVDFKPTTNRAIRRFRQTVFDAAYKVPEWAPDVVYYYIFPDRFRNGNPANDPLPGVAKYHDHTVELHANWNDKPYVPGTGDGSDAHYNNDFFGGDLEGIIQKLDYIKDLGANTLYLTPIFKGASNHKYDTADYRQVDPGFGTNADFERLTAEAAKRGMRVIPDTSLNHTGNDSVYFNRFGNHDSVGAFQDGKINSQSPYADWYTLDASQSDPAKQYKGWVDVADLPELNKASRGWRNYAFGAKDSVMKTWLDRGAAGWRMDVVPWVPDDFWREWRSAVKAHQPHALTVAETWFDASKYLLGDMFDSTMNYIFRNTVLGYAAGGKARSLYPNIELMREAYPPQAFYALMNLLSSHDQARALHQFGWHADTSDEKAIAEARQRLKLAVLFQMTFPGSPTVYYGDEVAVTGGDDPYNRATYPWADKGGKPDADMLASFKQIIGLRNQHAVLRRGTIDAPLYLDDHSIVLLRQLGNSVAVTATNNSTTTKTVTVQLPPGIRVERFTDAFGGPAVVAKQGKLTLTLPSLFGVVLLGTQAEVNAARNANASVHDLALKGVFEAREQDWRNGAIVYQVLVDRFVPPSNLNAKRVLYPPPKVLHRWNEEAKRGKYVPATNVWSHELDFWGGDLPGVTTKLGYLQDLGVDVLYLNPIHLAYTNHKYDALDYLKISPEFGTPDDFARLTQETHAKGMKLVLDGVFNHMGRNSDLFRKAQSDSASRYRDWFFFGDQYPGGARSWFQASNLPELRLENPAVRDYLYAKPDSVIQTWLRNGIDGWRLDVAPDLGPKYLSELTEAAHAAKPGSLVVGEIPNYPKEWFPAVDAVMNFTLRDIVLNTVNGLIAPATAAAMVDRTVQEAGIEPMLKSWLLLDNHDNDRLAHALRKVSEQRLAQLLQFTLPGSPNLYYGGEVGMTGGEDPANRSPMRWDWVKDSNSTLRWTKQLIQLRKQHRALRVGNFRLVNADKLLAFERYTDRVQDTVVVLVNPGRKAVTERVLVANSKLMNGSSLVDVLDAKAAPLRVMASMVTVTIPPGGYRVVVPQVAPAGGYSVFKRVQ